VLPHLHGLTPQPELFNRAVIDACASYIGAAEERRASASMPHAIEKSHTADASEWVKG